MHTARDLARILSVAGIKLFLFFLPLGCGIVLLLVEVLSDKVDSLQTAPERLGRFELAERSAGEGGEFAKRPWPESLPSRTAILEAGRSWRGQVREGWK